YFSINAGSLFALGLIPFLRGGIQCFGRDCFPLAFGVPGLLMLVSFLIFIAGWKEYKKVPPSRQNIALTVAKCIGTALKRRYTTRERLEEDVDWLEYALPEYTREMIHSVRSFIDVAIIFMPLVLFWALFDQQASTWVIQAQCMNCRVGPLTLMAEQMSFINPLLIIILVPLFEVLIYPCLKRLISVTPLRKMAFGGLLSSLSFLVAGLLQFEVNKSIPVIPQSDQISLWTIDDLPVMNTSGHYFLLEGRERLMRATEYSIGGELIDMRRYSGKGVVVKGRKGGNTILPFQVQKPMRTMIIYMIVEEEKSIYNTTLKMMNSKGEAINTYQLVTSNASDDTSYIEIKLPIISDGKIDLRYGKNLIYRKVIEFGMGSVLVAYFEGTEMKLLNVVEENGMNLLWTIPQYILITMGEILISVTGLEFAYSQASADMKSVLQAVFLSSVCLGNVIDMGISGSHIIGDPSLEFFLYAALMLAVMIIFILLANRYKYKDMRAEESGSECGRKKGGNALPLASTDTPL
ncbi:hypothetical protein PMAYCL1PPCAC_23984, partial [Pristionchus mayeri]